MSAIFYHPSNVFFRPLLSKLCDTSYKIDSHCSCPPKYTAHCENEYGAVMRSSSGSSPCSHGIVAVHPSAAKLNDRRNVRDSKIISRPSIISVASFGDFPGSVSSIYDHLAPGWD